MTASEGRLLPAKQVKHRYGDISDMTLYRWAHNADLGFPEPVYINGRRFWYEENLDAFDRRMTGPRRHRRDQRSPCISVGTQCVAQGPHRVRVGAGAGPTLERADRVAHGGGAAP